MKRVKEGRAAHPTPSSLPTAVHRQVMRASAEYMADIRAAGDSSKTCGTADQTGSAMGQEAAGNLDFESQEAAEAPEV